MSDHHLLLAQRALQRMARNIGPSRRDILRGAIGLGALALAAPFAARAQMRTRFTAEPFTLGVASGYPHPGGVSLWTRLAPQPALAGIKHCNRLEQVVARGVVQVPEGRQLFGPLTVQENLELGSYSRRGKRGRPAADKMEEVFELFPRLEERRLQHAATLSGGEQQMLAVGRALMAEPRVLLLDEPSMGLAPLVVKEIFRTLRELNERGLTLLLVEQDARIALSLAHRGLVMERGRIVMEDGAASLLAADIQSIYFGHGGGRTDVTEDGHEKYPVVREGD